MSLLLEDWVTCVCVSLSLSFSFIHCLSHSGVCLFAFLLIIHTFTPEASAITQETVIGAKEGSALRHP